MKFLIYFILAYAIVSAAICLCGVDFYGRNFPYECLTAVFVFLIGFGVYKFPSQLLERKRAMFLAGFGAANMTMLVILFTVYTYPVSDFHNVYEMAEGFNEGTLTSTTPPYGYGYLYNWQIGMALLEALLFKMFSQSIVVLKVFNLLLINATLYLVYITGKRLLSERVGIAAFLIMSVFYPMLVTVGQLSSQNVVTPLILLFILAAHSKKFLWTGIILPIIAFVRPVGIILFLALICLLIYRLCIKKNSARRIALQFAAFSVPCVLLTAAFNVAVIKSGVTETPVSRPTLPWFKFYQGLYISDWNNPAEKIAEFDGDVKLYNRWTAEEVKNAYTHQFGNTMLNDFKKMTMFLGMYDWKFAYTYCQLFPEFGSKKTSCFVAFGWAEYIVLLLMALSGYGRYRKLRDGTDLLQLLFVGFVCVYFFIEAWPDYRYEFYPLLFIIAGASALKQNANEIISE